MGFICTGAGDGLAGLSAGEWALLAFWTVLPVVLLLSAAAAARSASHTAARRWLRVLATIVLAAGVLVAAPIAWFVWTVAAC